tara:strand:- start:1721 stop:2128 length:408 start_codon:yes stop_codon:yes gene_type:complete
MKIEVPNGEIADKVSILMIKSVKITDSQKLNNIHKELHMLSFPLSEFMGDPNDMFKKNSLWGIFFDLKKINEELWDIEDQIRQKEKEKIFDEEFIELARMVYITNDKRSKMKAEINEQSKSLLREEKSYTDYLSQ